jgi:hypothetical protein
LSVAGRKENGSKHEKGGGRGRQVERRKGRIAQKRAENGRRHAGRWNWKGKKRAGRRSCMDTAKLRDRNWKKLVEIDKRLTRAGAADPKGSMGMAKIRDLRDDEKQQAPAAQINFKFCSVL